MKFDKRFLLLLMILLFANNASADSECELTVKVGSGSQLGLYYYFVKDWSNYVLSNNYRFCIENISTQGSIDNLNKLEKEIVDFALVQNDIGHYVYSGIHGHKKFSNFYGLKPLYKEYVQVVYRSDGEVINTISDLQSKLIATGGQESGGYWNAIDLLEAADLADGFHYKSVFSNEHPIEVLKIGRADAAIYTSAKVHPHILESKNEELKFIGIPPSAVRRLAVDSKKSYYDHGTLKYRQNKINYQVPTLAVHAYMVVSDSIDSSLIFEVKNSLDSYVDHIKSSPQNEHNLEFIDEKLADYPFPMHFSVNSSFLDKVYLSLSYLNLANWFKYLLVFSALLVIYAAFKGNRKRYNAAGLINNQSRLYKAKQSLFSKSKYLVGLVFWCFWLYLAATFIMLEEEKFSSARGIESKLEGFGTSDRMMWLVKTAYTTLPSEKPLSESASIIVFLTELFGLAAFLYPVYVFYDLHNKKVRKKLTGEWNYEELQSHVVLCGWNTHAIGLIRSLLSDFSPNTKKKIAVVAEIDSDTPMKDYGFDYNRVIYVRGESSSIRNLKRAGIENASEAIILADYKNIESKNTKSVSTVLSIRKIVNENLNNNLFIGAELIHKDNENIFKSVGAEALIKVHNVADKIMAISALSSEISDFVIDFLTYDDYFELYSKYIYELPSSISAMALASSNEGCEENYSSNNIRRLFIEHDLQLIGHSSEVDGKEIVKFTNNLDNDICQKEDKLLYFSQHKNSVDNINWKNNRSISKVTLPEFSPCFSNLKVGIIGEINRANRIKSHIGNMAITVNVYDSEDILSDIVSGSTQKIREHFKELDKILILDINPLIDTDALKTKNTQSHSNITSLLILNTLNKLRNDDLNYKITIELKEHYNRELYRDAGADDIVITFAMIERMLAKMVFNHGKMYELVDQLITIGKGAYLYTHEIDSDSDPFLNINIKELFLGDNKKYQVCGWLPNDYDLLKYLKKNTMGTDHHYITAFNTKTIRNILTNKHIVSKGDKLILIIFNS